jgi:hypothetical protein
MYLDRKFLRVAQGVLLTRRSPNTSSRPEACRRKLTGGALVFLLAVDAPLAEAGRTARCRGTCDAAIAYCIISTGQRLRACERQLIRTCRRQGLAACEVTPPSTSTTTTTATTVTTPTSSTATATTGPTITATTTSTTTSSTFMGQRFVDNGDGTVADLQTGLQWEKKDGADGTPGFGTPNLGNPHDVDNRYTWSTSVDAADGTAFTDFLSRLNSCASNDGSSVVSAGFAGHCDWRLPTITELRTIVDPSAPGCGSGRCCFPCIDPVFGPTQVDFHWSATSVADPLRFCDFSGAPCAFGLYFGYQTTDALMKSDFIGRPVRAVRGDLHACPSVSSSGGSLDELR